MSRFALTSFPRMWLLAAAAAIVALVCLAPASVHAANTPLVVDTNADNPALSTCDAPVGDCSLRGAVTYANTHAGTFDIQLQDFVTYTLTNHGTANDNNGFGDLDVLESLQIEGRGAVIDGDAADRVLDFMPVAANSTLNITDLTIRNGLVNTLGGGGGIRMVNGKLVSDNLDLIDNAADFDSGGGIVFGGDSSGDLTESTFSGNTTVSTNSGFGGGGLRFNGGTGTLVIKKSSFTNNSGGFGGGALLDGSDVTITDTDFIGNHATNDGFGVGGGIFSSANLTIEGGRINNNDAFDLGGGFSAQQVTHITGTEIAGNDAPSVGGLNINTAGSLVEQASIHGNTATSIGGISVFVGILRDSEVFGNSATDYAGGVFLNGNGNGSLDHDLVYDNHTQGYGGGIYASSGVQDIENVTITGNSALLGGGGISKGDPNAGPVAVPQGGPPPGVFSVSFSTISENNSGEGANIAEYANGGTISVLGSIVAEPQVGDNCNEHVGSDGYNIVDDNSCGLTETGDQLVADARLSGLTNNGGFTRTIPLITDSPAIDAVTDDEVCPPPTDDQRGVLRPKGNACDAGAFESAFSATPGPSPTPTTAPTATPVPTNQPTPSPIASRIWGDTNCSSAVDALDALVVASKAAVLTVTTPPGCVVGQTVHVDGVSRIWGDNDCSGTLNATDAVFVLADLAGVPRDPADGCPALGDAVAVTP
ncbi:MAG: choice-of-anchor Q domain-containing protein [Chloroflexota bacterium]